ncbi:PEP-utilizing enzyme [Streptomyces europaeiscabiei]|uniref:PEP-utilizing enzyme n=1 Tax=Streptomyces europaeiscabiei TaxID=146819 RepID=A0ABU4NIM5_9ACTN|nr:PEP-utilizing enzyme [Streptomyces europaeiscabiei]MDX2524258.1 PEP-utilizing enzyme [Streptomyces europaeiscabiei]MDX2759894.1 PEP-utilizing enzyme [Streptomyces europaeiscabiei]MDX2767176.1 PEP-utilizing enzyme [Streptomyces europaeiscabiei]MDX3545521.1 PEP-utilizing enzyme [Streptomyces europaeiscabiei]MDX3555082.1 PEP-utilizing enzyme [Streptomyces europaeiscabiei]
MKSWITDWQRSERLPHYTRANAGETLPEPASPLGWTLVWGRGLHGWRKGFVGFGIYHEEEVAGPRPPFVGMFGGYFYLNLSHMRLFGIRMGQTADQIDAAFVGQRSDTPAYVAHPDDQDGELTAKAGGTLQRMLGQTNFPEADADRERLRRLRRERPDPSGLSDAELVAYARSLLDQVETTFQRHVESSLPASVGPAILGPLCASVDRPGDMLDLIGGLGDVDSASPSDGLWTLSRQVAASAELTALFDEGPAAVERALDGAIGDVKAFRDAFEEFLATSGDRGPNEWDIHALSWEAAPVQALALVDRIRHSSDDGSPAARRARLSSRREQTAREIRDALPEDAQPMFDAGMHASQVWIPARERTKANCVTVVNEIRMAVRELGRRGVEAGRLAAPEDVMMLLDTELDDYVADPEAFGPVIAQRLQEYAGLHELEPPFFIADDARTEIDTWPRRAEERTEAAVEGDALSGVGGSHGTYTGRVRVVTDPASCEALEPGEVLVAPITDAAWTPLFLVAGAAVVDVGAINSHAVVVCRELGIPAVISVEGGTRRLRDGMVITVDGDRGTVTVDSVPAPLGV